ncbi:MAG: hypothetical protein WBA16_10580 [Nonlabens sp.]
MRFTLGVLLILTVLSCKPVPKQTIKENKFASTRPVSEVKINLLSQDTISIRALEYKEGTYYFSGSRNLIGQVDASTNHVTLDTITLDEQFEFRSIAVLDDRVLALNAGAPARIVAINKAEKDQKIVYKENTDGVFYDSMKFLDDKMGIVMGDPTTNGNSKCIVILKTTDGGDNWRRIDCGNLPAFVEGEAAFAASNSNISINGDHVWIATGGKLSRILKSTDSGESFKAIDTPMAAGGTMTGTFAMDFYDQNTGIIIGGDWENKTSNYRNLAITENGGESWNLIAEGSGVGYCSDIQFVPESDGMEVLAVGSEGIWYSKDRGQSWSRLSEQGFYTAAMESGTTGIVAGRNKIARFELK